MATGAQYAALAAAKRSYYTAPIKALVSEKFFGLCDVFGAANVGMLTGDAAVNAAAPIIACTAEVLANIALREGADADIGLVVMDEFAEVARRPAENHHHCCPPHSDTACRPRLGNLRDFTLSLGGGHVHAR